MIWQEKFAVAKSALDANDALDEDFYLKAPSLRDSEVASLKEQHPLVSDEHTEFLLYSNGADIAQFTLFSSDNLESKGAIHADVYDPSLWCVVGQGPGGDPLLLNSAGEIFQGFGKTLTPERVYIAESFSDFLCNVLMGKRYPSLFGVSEPFFDAFIEGEKEEDPWMSFLIEQAWL